ncbi:hypothetical protein J2754_001484 [Halarchaeum solikamskense]|uniref:hypothetical protein n=1 Tax=Halarchaeum nitratireducens TaxID=489913 RepID=UPI001B3ABB55|nr:hypothetical protein [Halarchaeum solikamskense]MBP2251163.1 hypothetical protein [Halarchaeum solikamskense]
MTDSARITGWEFSNNRVRVAIEADSLTTVTITDGAAGLEDAGASRIPQTTQRVWGGETTIVTMPVATAFDGHVVGVAIGDTGVRLSTDMQQGEDPLQYFGGTSGLFSGIGITILTSLLGAWYVLRKEETGVTKA